MLEQYWFLRDGETGLHAFSRLTYHNEAVPFLRNLQELRTLFRPNTDIWTHLITNGAQYAPLPGKDAVRKEVVVQGTVVKHQPTCLGDANRTILSKMQLGTWGIHPTTLMFNKRLNISQNTRSTTRGEATKYTDCKNRQVPSLELSSDSSTFVVSQVRRWLPDGGQKHFGRLAGHEHEGYLLWWPAAL